MMVNLSVSYLQPFVPSIKEAKRSTIWIKKPVDAPLAAGKCSDFTTAFSKCNQEAFEDEKDVPIN